MTQSYLCSFNHPIILALVFLKYIGAECQVTCRILWDNIEVGSGWSFVFGKSITILVRVSKTQHFLAISVNIFYHKILRFQFSVEINAFSNYICFDSERTVVTDAWLKIHVHFLTWQSLVFDQWHWAVFTSSFASFSLEN